MMRAAQYSADGPGGRGEVLALLEQAEHPDLVAWCLARIARGIAARQNQIADSDVDATLDATLELTARFAAIRERS